MWTGMGFSQRWGMFEKVPSKDGWYVADGRLADGSQVDLLRDGAPTVWSRPDVPLESYPNHRWQKCFREMSYADAFGYQVFRQPVADYLFRSWSREHPDRPLTELELVFCMEEAGSPESPARETIARVAP